MHPTVCDTLADIAQNSIEAGASEIEIRLARNGRETIVSVRDNGCGMTAEQKRRAEDPFYTAPGKHPKRKVGLGLPFARMTAEQCGGRWRLESEPGKGTFVEFSMAADNVDAPPMGDVPATLVGLMAWEGDREIRVVREDLGGTYEVSRGELAEALGGDWTDAGTLALAKEFFSSNEDEIQQRGETWRN